MLPHLRAGKRRKSVLKYSVFKKILCAAALIPAVLCAVSCSPSGVPEETSGSSGEATGNPPATIKNPHECEWGPWSVSVPASCTEDGVEVRSCVCGKTEERAIPASHSYYECVRQPSVLSGGFTRHLCSACADSYDDTRTDKLSPSEGLAFMDDQGGNGAVLCGAGTCTDKEIAVPAEYNGKAVTGVWTQAFTDNTDITAVYLPEGVTFIGPMAFGGCSSLKTVGIPSTVTEISGYAFYGCSSLAGVVATGAVKAGEAAFAMCSGLKCVEFGSSLAEIGTEAFACCTSLEVIFYGGGESAFEAVLKGEGWNMMDTAMKTAYLGS